MNDASATSSGEFRLHDAASAQQGGPDKSADPRLRIAVVTPIFDDFISFTHLCGDIDRLAANWDVDLSILGVDDGSRQVAESVGFERPLHNIRQIRLVKLLCNLGHQRAIAIGLIQAAQEDAFDAVVVADCDGEDQPADIGRLIREHRAAPDSIVVARRSKRSESLQFKAFYLIYKTLFRAFTGKKIDFGNFMLLPKAALGRLVNMPDIWNHLAGAVLRSRLPLRPIGCHRGRRYAGQSSMNLVGLLVHGLSAVSVFSDFVLARMLVASAAIMGLAVAAAAAAIIVRLTTDWAIPGWTTNVVGGSMIILSETLLFSMIGSLSILRNRSAGTALPRAFAATFVDRILTVPRDPSAEAQAADDTRQVDRVPDPKGIDASTGLAYSGNELELFAEATTWRAYWQAQITPFIGPRVLEVGAGLGSVVRSLAHVPMEHVPVEHWVALEPDPEMSERLVSLALTGGLPGLCEPRCGTTAQMPPGECFDTVLYIDVLEHIEDDRAELARVARHLDPGGTLVVLAPAHQWLYSSFDASIGHFRRYTIRQLCGIAPPDLVVAKAVYLDAVGLLASLGNRLLLQQGTPTPAQIRLWDRVMVRGSKWVDPLLRFRAGKSVLVVWRKV